MLRVCQVPIQPSNTLGYHPHPKFFAHSPGKCRFWDETNHGDIMKQQFLSATYPGTFFSSVAPIVRLRIPVSFYESLNRKSPELYVVRLQVVVIRSFHQAYGRQTSWNKLNLSPGEPPHDQHHPWETTRGESTASAALSVLPSREGYKSHSFSPKRKKTPSKPGLGGQNTKLWNGTLMGACACRCLLYYPDSGTSVFHTNGPIHAMTRYNLEANDFVPSRCSAD